MERRLRSDARRGELPRHLGTEVGDQLEGGAVGLLEGEPVVGLVEAAERLDTSRANRPPGGSVATTRWPSTCRTVQCPHSDGVFHWESRRPSNVSMSEVRSSAITAQMSMGEDARSAAGGDLDGDAALGREGGDAGGPHLRARGARHSTCWARRTAITWSSRVARAKPMQRR